MMAQARVTEMKMVKSIQILGIFKSKAKNIYFLIKKFLLKYSWCTILCKLQVYNIVIHNF